MTPEVRNWIAGARAKHITPAPGRVLEIGSLNVNGQVRDLFPGTEYVGIDNVPGSNVDVVLNGHALLTRFASNSFDLVLCLETLEHDPAFWLTLEGIRTVVKPAGFVCISVPIVGFPEHHHPDYWRFLPDAGSVLFSGLQVLAIEQLKHLQYTELIGIARKD